MNKARLFAWLVVGSTAALMITFAGETTSMPNLGVFLFWIALLAAVDLLPVSLGFGTEVTMAIPIHFALAILYTDRPWIAMLICGLGAFDRREIRREIPIWLALFNRAQIMLAVGATSAILGIRGGSPFQVDLVAIAAVVHLAINLGLVSVMVHLRQGVPIGGAFRSLLPDPLAGFWISYIVLIGLGVVTALVDLRTGEWAVAAMLIPILFARLSLLGARAQQELSERVRKQQEALLAATEKVFQERENERKRIAEDIHDSSLQMLAAAAYGCGNASEFLSAGHSDHAKEAITSAHEAIDGAMKGLRESLVHLRKSSVEEGGLMETVRKYVDQVSTVWGTRVTIEGGIDNEPPIPVALAAFQILQEGLVNAMKHAQDSTVTVRIGDRDGMVHIVVEDTGPGFDPDAEVGADHVGMQLMKERAARVGGRIELDAKQGAGTRLEAILPGGVAQ